MTRRKRYSAEFKREALRRADEPGVTDALVAEELGINARQLHRWRSIAKKDGESAFPGQGKARDEEMMRLRRKLAKAEQERDFLRDKRVGIKDAARTLPGSRSEIWMYPPTPQPVSDPHDVPTAESVAEWLLRLANEA